MFDIVIKFDGNENIGMFEDIEIMLFMRKELRIYSTPIGNLSHSLQQKILGAPFLLNSLQLQYLYDFGHILHNPEIKGTKYLIFKYFTLLRYIVKDGIKFGCDFLIYKGDPLYCHAEAMIFEGKVISIQRITELCRISNDTNKKLLVAFICPINDAIEIKEIS